MKSILFVIFVTFWAAIALGDGKIDLIVNSIIP